MFLFVEDRNNYTPRSGCLECLSLLGFRLLIAFRLLSRQTQGTYVCFSICACVLISKTFYICVCRLKPMTSHYYILQFLSNTPMFFPHIHVCETSFQNVTSLILIVFELPIGLLNQYSYSAPSPIAPLPPTSLCSLCSWILALLYFYPLSSPSY